MNYFPIGGVEGAERARVVCMERTEHRISDVHGEVFAGVSNDFLVKVCEGLMSRTDPHNKAGRTATELGGVQLRLYVNNHWSGFDRYMIVGQDWTVGFNLREPNANTDPDAIITAFSNQFEMTTPHLTGEREFLRDMMVLLMTQSDWEIS